MTIETLSSYRTLATRLRGLVVANRDHEVADALDALCVEVARLASIRCGTCVYHGDCSVQNRLTLQRLDGATGMEDFCSLHTRRDHAKEATVKKRSAG